jgi:hypothetical protein
MLSEDFSVSENHVDIETAIKILNDLAPGAIRGATAKPGHQYYEAVRRSGPLSKCTCGQRKLGWRFPEFIAARGATVWSVGRDANSRKITCGPKGYHSSSYSNTPACCQTTPPVCACVGPPATTDQSTSSGASTGDVRSLASGMATVLASITRYASDRGIWTRTSDAYDLFPSEPPLLKSGVGHYFPEPWPNRSDHGIYLFFSGDEDPIFLYVGKSSERTSSINLRLNGYIDVRARRLHGKCVLRDEWHGRYAPWGIRPRYVVTVALRTDPKTGTCPDARRLEDYLIANLRPAENIRGKAR